MRDLCIFDVGRTIKLYGLNVILTEYSFYWFSVRSGHLLDDDSFVQDSCVLCCAGLPQPQIQQLVINAFTLLGWLCTVLHPNIPAFGPL